jgi:chromosome segregation and condensation protein ScpB
MEIPLKLKEDKKYLEVIRMLANVKHPVEITPYNKLRNREMEVLAVLNYLYNEKYATIPEKERNLLIFAPTTRKEIQDIIGKDDSSVSKEVVYNIIKDLRKKGFIDGTTMIKGRMLPNVDKLTFKFV